jgi:hypothetical protein
MFDWLFLLVGLAVLAFPVVTIVALKNVIDLRKLVLQLDLRLSTLEHDLLPRVGRPAPPTPAAPESPVAVEPSASAVVSPQSPPTSVPLTSPTPTAASLQPSVGFEERFGTRWVVWVGGVALALGGIFLVRYTV